MEVDGFIKIKKHTRRSVGMFDKKIFNGKETISINYNTNHWRDEKQKLFVMGLFDLIQKHCKR